VSYFGGSKSTGRLMKACSGVNRARGTVSSTVAPPLPLQGAEVAMLMFKRSQLYVGFALAALAEIIVRAVVR